MRATTCSPAAPSRGPRAIRPLQPCRAPASLPPSRRHRDDHGDVRRQDRDGPSHGHRREIQRTPLRSRPSRRAPLVEGQPATITGTKFGATADANVVRIGGVPASVTAATRDVAPDRRAYLNCKPAQNVNVDVTVAGNTAAPRSRSHSRRRRRRSHSRRGSSNSSRCRRLLPAVPGDRAPRRPT